MLRRSPSGVRVFAALELPADLKARLAQVIALLATPIPAGAVRWARPEGIHLTLQFYGEVPPPLVEALSQALERAAATAAGPLTVTVGGLGVFPNPAHPRVIWAGLTGDLEPLRALQAAVETAAAPLGFKPEERPYSPHLTLGRMKGQWTPALGSDLAAALHSAAAAATGSARVEHVSLMRSELQPAGSVYICLHRAALAGPISAAGIQSGLSC